MSQEWLAVGGIPIIDVIIWWELIEQLVKIEWLAVGGIPIIDVISWWELIEQLVKSD